MSRQARKPPRRMFLAAAAQREVLASTGTDAPVSIVDIVAARSSLWTVPEVARLLSMSPQSLYDMVKHNRLQSITIGASIRLDPKTTAEWLRERMR